VLITDDILEVIEIWNLQKPSLYASEICERLLRDSICTPPYVPSVRQVQSVINKKLGMTHKKLTSIPSDYLTPENLAKVDDYLNITSRLDKANLHFFDESSVVVTSGNHIFGSGYRGRPAIEVQRYASNANYTVNLMHSAFGVDHFNIIPGASNGQEMLNFFHDVLDMERDNGVRIIFPGDVVIMDNCGFHHGRITERLLRNMLKSRGAELLFQPPYSPHLNMCELCFREMKIRLRSNEQYAIQQTEMAINDAVNQISALHSLRYFRHCGYF